MDPKCDAIIFADRIIRDVKSRKYFLLGIFTFIVCQRLPGQFAEESSSFIELSGVDGSGEFVARFSDPKNVKLADAQLKVSRSVPNMTAQFAIPLPPVRLELPGDYSLSIHFEDRQIGIKLIQVYTEESFEEFKRLMARDANARTSE